MKKLLTFAVMLIAGICTMSAWTPSDTDYRLMDADSLYGQTSMKTLRADDGTIYHVWLRKPAGVLAKDPTFGYYLHLQIFDPAGNEVFDKEGKLVSSKTTKSWLTDYGVALADNGDIVIAYYDVREDIEGRTNSHAYLYRYDKNGHAVWDAEGIKLPIEKTYENAFRSYEQKPQLCISGENIYVSCVHTESYMVKADSTNWEPNPWFPTEMPDSVQMGETNMYYFKVNNDGTFDWKFITSCPILSEITPCADGDFYLLYTNDDNGLCARRINQAGQDVWDEPVVVESESLGNGYVTTPGILHKDNGDLVLVYRKLTSFAGYASYNCLGTDGTTYGTGVSLTGSTDNNCGTYKAALNGDSLLVVWKYIASENNLYANLVSTAGNGSFLWPEWPFDHSKGISYDTNDMWGFTPITVVRQSDGWAIIYANSQSYNAANLYVIKIDEYGNLLWSKQICEENFVANSYSIVDDGRYAYFFIATDSSYDTDKGGGLRVMCIDLTNSDATAIGDIQTEQTVGEEVRYDLTGRVVTADTKGIQIVKYSDGSVRKVLVK